MPRWRSFPECCEPWSKTHLHPLQAQCSPSPPKRKVPAQSPFRDFSSALLEIQDLHLLVILRPELGTGATNRGTPKEETRDLQNGETDSSLNLKMIDQVIELTSTTQARAAHPQ